MSSVPPSSLSNLTWSTLKRLSLSSCELYGELPTQLVRFQYLQYLDLSYNDGLTGYLPESNWTSPLEILLLSSCNFIGSLPSSLGNLTQVTYLDLDGNNFEGDIPDVFGSLNKLASLTLSSSQFSSQIPPSIFNLTKVSLLDLSNNRLEGELPAHVNGLQNLQLLDLSWNLISGVVPSWLFTLPSLKYIYLSNNNLLSFQIDGKLQKPNSVLDTIDFSSNNIQGLILPSFLFELVNLTHLRLSSNNLSGVITSEMVSKLKSLKILDLSNNKIQGSISKWDSQGWEHLTELNLSYNSLTGLEQYPAGQNLEILDVRSNQLQGSLLAPPPSLKQFFMSNNSLTGEVPTLICNLTSLQVLDLSMNNLSGTIPPCLGNSSLSLVTINLQLNHFHGQIPAFESDTLETLVLNDNQLLEGLLPRSLVNCTSLRFLNVANNKLNDTFPHWLGLLPKLLVLVLRSNRFHGPLLENALAPVLHFQSLEVFDLSQNVFTGTLPTNLLQNLTAMKVKKKVARCSQYSRVRENYQNSVKVMIKRLQLELQLGSALPSFTVMDFSENQFYGPIPEVLGELGSLLVLNLSYNNLTGFIPPVLGHMAALESLDLSSNKLGGRIPTELTNLTFLEVLNLSHNTLVGPIRQGMQFNSFDYDSYIGNPGLWGCPLPKKCPRINPTEPPPPFINVDPEDDIDRDDLGISHIWKVAAMGFGCGTVLGLSMGYMVFATGRPWWIVRKIERDWQIHVTNWFHNRTSQTRRRRNANATRSR